MLSFSGDILNSHPLSLGIPEPRFFFVPFPHNSVAYICATLNTLVFFDPESGSHCFRAAVAWRRLRFLNLRAGSASYGDHFSRALNIEKLIPHAHTQGREKQWRKLLGLGKRGG